MTNSIIGPELRAILLRRREAKLHSHEAFEEIQMEKIELDSQLKQDLEKAAQLLTAQRREA